MNDFVFKRNSLGELTFVGDFDALYSAVEDPWGQSNSDPNSPIGKYYELSRNHLVSLLERYIEPEGEGVLYEFGCGTGFVAREISKKFTRFSIFGFDISESAVSKANQLHRGDGLEFCVSNILKLEECRRHAADVVVVSNLLWYVLPDLETLFRTAVQYLRPGGVLIVQNAFFKDRQEFGRDIVDGFTGFFNVFSRLRLAFVPLSSYEFLFLSSSESLHDEGCFLCRLS
jgi:SAM-dependent methyltransferase